MTSPRLGCGLVVTAVLLLSGCASGSDVGPPTAPVSGPAGSSALAPCEAQPSPPAVPDVPGLRLPPEAAVYSVFKTGPLTQAEGVVELTPVQMRAHYEQRDDLDVLSVEDETFESEVLVTDGVHRMFVKTQVLCATASNFKATVGSEADAGAVPTPAGSPAPAGTSAPGG